MKIKERKQYAGLLPVVICLICAVIWLCAGGVEVLAGTVQKDGLEVTTSVEDDVRPGHEESRILKMNIVNGNAWAVYDVELSQLLPEGIEAVDSDTVKTIGTLEAGGRAELQVEIREIAVSPTPTAEPTGTPTVSPTASPTVSPTTGPTAKPTSTVKPTAKPVSQTTGGTTTGGNLAGGSGSGTGQVTQTAAGVKSSASAAKTEDGLAQGIILWSILGGAAGIAVLTMLYVKRKKKKGGRLLGLFLCVILSAGMLLPSAEHAYASGAGTQTETPEAEAAAASAARETIDIEETVVIRGHSYTCTGRVTYRPLVDPDRMVTITFETFEGQKIVPVQLHRGEKLVDVPQAKCATKTFLGWYTDEQLTKQFYASEPVEENLTLYADYTATKIDFESSDAHESYEEDCDPMREIEIQTEEAIDANNWKEFIEITPASEDTTGRLMVAGFVITPVAGGYRLTPEQPGYQPGFRYQAKLLRDTVSFTGKSAELRTFEFRIKKDAVEEVTTREPGQQMLDTDGEVWTDGGLIQIPWADVISQNGLHLIVRKNEKTDQLTAGDSDRHIIYSTLRVSDGAEVGDDEENTLYGNVISIEPVTLPDNTEGYALELEEASPQDIFTDMDVCAEKVLDIEEQVQAIDTEAVEQQVRESPALLALTETLADSLNSSETIQDMIEPESEVPALLSMDYRAISEAPMLRSSSGIFNSFTDHIQETSKRAITIEDLMEGLTVSAYVGKATNENFELMKAHPFDYVRIVITYDTVIKGSVKLHISFEVNECMLMSALARADGSVYFNWKKFKLDSDITFEFAIRTWSETDVGLTILVSSTNDDPEVIDISEEIKKAMQAEEQDVTGDVFIDNLKKTMQMDTKPINLVTVPLVDVQTSFLEVLNLQVRTEFIVDVDFSAGLTANYSYLTANEIGITGMVVGPKLEMYQNQLSPIARYEFNMFACGHMGVEAKFQMGLYVSILHLTRFGKVGLEGEVAAYTDLYGYIYLKASQKNPYTPEPEIAYAGGYYLDIGVSFDLRLVAISEIFKKKAQLGIGTFVNTRLSLYSMGNKEMMVGFTNTDIGENTVTIRSEAEAAGHTETLGIDPIQGKFLNITTLETSSHQLHADALRAQSDSPFFDASVDAAGNLVLKQKWIPAFIKTLDFHVTLYYDGGSASFSSNGALKRIHVVWNNSTYFEEGGKQKEAKIFYHLSGKIAGKETTDVIERRVLVGDRLSYCSLQGSEFAEYYTIVEAVGRDGIRIGDETEEREYHFDLTLRPIQTLVYFTYIPDDPALVPGDTTNSYITDIYCYNLGELPMPELALSGDYAVFRKWNHEITRIPGVSESKIRLYNLGRENGTRTDRVAGHLYAGQYQQYVAEYESRDLVSIYYNVSLPNAYLYGTEKVHFNAYVGSMQALNLYADDSDAWMRLLPKNLDLPKGYQLAGWKRDPMMTTAISFDAILKRNRHTIFFNFGEGYLSREDENLPPLKGYQANDLLEGSIWYQKDGACYNSGTNENFAAYDVRLFELPGYQDADGYYQLEGWKDQEGNIVKPGTVTEATELWAYYGEQIPWKYQVRYDFGAGVFQKELFDVQANRPEGTQAEQFFWEEDGRVLVFQGGDDASNQAVTRWVKTIAGNITDAAGTYLTDWQEKDTADPKKGSRGLVYTATYDAEHAFTVTLHTDGGIWNVDGGSEDKSFSGKTGETYAFPEVHKENSQAETYTWSGWRRSDGTLVTEPSFVIQKDEEYTAVYEAVPRMYTVTCLADGGIFGDGEHTKTYQLPYGTVLTTANLESPVWEMDERNIYTFTGWAPELGTVTENVTYQAVYKIETRNYIITFDAKGGQFADKDGARSVLYGYDTDLSKENLEAPTRANDDTYSYTFAGWTPNLDLVKRDQTYEAVYLRKVLNREPIGVTIRYGTQVEDISVNGMPGVYEFYADPGDQEGDPLKYELSIRKDGVTLSGSAVGVAVQCFASQDFSEITLDNLQLSSRDYRQPLLIGPSDETTSLDYKKDFTVHLKGACLLSGSDGFSENPTTPPLEIAGMYVHMIGEGEDVTSLQIKGNVSLMGFFPDGTTEIMATIDYDKVKLK